MVVETRQRAKRRKMSEDGGGQGRPEAEEEDGDEAATHKVKAIVMDAADGPSIPKPATRGSRIRRVKHTHLSLTRHHGTTAIAHDCIRPENHDMLVHIAPVGEKVRYGQRSSLAIGHDYFRFRCPLGDVWHDAFTDICRHRSVKTGNPWIDRAIRSLPFQGLDMVHVVGGGKYSFVLAAKCQQKYSGLVAVKMLLHDRNHKQPVKVASTAAPWNVEYPEEVAIHRTLSHPNVVTWLDYMTYMNRRCIILEFAHLGDIDDLMLGTPGRFFTEVVAARYFRHMIAAVEYIHSENLVHRDIKCSNWVVDRHNVAKLIDFGCARRWSEGDPLMMDKPPGKPGYQLPEGLFPQPYNPRMADLWSLGVVLYKMVTSRLPFGAEPAFTPGLMRTIPLPKPSIMPLTQELCALMKGILHPNIGCRYSLNRIKQSDWASAPLTDKFYVSNYFRQRQPVKLKEGCMERKWKHANRLTRPPAVHNTWIVRHEHKHRKAEKTSAEGTEPSTSTEVSPDTDVVTAQAVTAQEPAANEDLPCNSGASSSLSDQEASTSRESSDALMTPAQRQATSSDARDDTAPTDAEVDMDDAADLEVVALNME